MLDIPSQVGKKNQKCDRAPGENPRSEQKFALLGQKKAEEQGKREDGDGIFVFKAKTGDSAKGEPESWVLCVDHAENRVSAARPEERVEGVHGELVVSDPPHCGSGGPGRTERDPEALRAEVAGGCGY